jgi:hypothetical protein
MPVRYDSGMAGGFAFPINTPQRQFQIFEDFVGAQNFDTDETVTLTLDSGTVAKDVTVHGGAVLMAAGDATESAGPQMQFNDGIILDEAGDLFFEARVRFASTAGTSNFTDEMFIGLAAVDSTLLADSGDKLSDVALLGFSSAPTDGGEITPSSGHLSLIGQNAASATATGSSVTDVKIDTAANSGVGVDDFVRLGIVVRNGEAQAFVNGEKTGAKISSLPTSGVIVPSFVCQSGAASTVAKVLIDYFLVSCGRSSTAL